MRSEIFFIIIGMAVVTFFTRFASAILFRQTGVPVWFERWMKHVPTGILTALIIPTLLLPKGYLDVSTQNHYLLAGVVAILVAYRYRSVLVTMGVGLMVMLSMRWFGV
ncbi:AzlD domain-containing protein [Pelosinus sp. sgz500959]|uniref:AzlD domain-containing protein n=1 Tax=Pelosinus sp. sgz500959 TaxID=3242472 RepID=UPI00366FD2F8